MAALLTDKVVLVTGGSTGIGRASALTFAREGAKVVVADVVTDKAQETVQLITDAGGEARFIKADVTQAAEVEAMVQHTVDAYGRLDCAHNNAGIEGALGRTADYAEQDWDRVIQVNLTGVWLCLKYEIQQMLKDGGGAIVNTASGAGLVGAPQMPAYVASKHGVVGRQKQQRLSTPKQVFE